MNKSEKFVKAFHLLGNRARYKRTSNDIAFGSAK